MYNWTLAFFVVLSSSQVFKEKEKGYINPNSNIHSLTYSSIALWNGIETLMVTGLSLSEAKEAWLEGFRALFAAHTASKKEQS